MNIIIEQYYNYSRTCLRSLDEIASEFCSEETVSIVGIGKLLSSSRFVRVVLVPSRLISTRWWKHEPSKWAENKQECDEGCQSWRCRCTNWIHDFRSEESFLGNSCTDVPTMEEFFLQLPSFGPPATQYLPR